MESESHPTGPDVSHLRVPEELFRQLDEANQRFHTARTHREHAVEGTEYRHQERIDKTAAELQEAERHVEEITKKIQDVLNRPTL